MRLLFISLLAALSLIIEAKANSAATPLDYPFQGGSLIINGVRLTVEAGVFDNVLDEAQIRTRLKANRYAGKYPLAEWTVGGRTLTELWHEALARSRLSMPSSWPMIATQTSADNVLLNMTLSTNTLTASLEKENFSRLIADIQVCMLEKEGKPVSDTNKQKILSSAMDDANKFEHSILKDNKYLPNLFMFSALGYAAHRLTQLHLEGEPKVYMTDGVSPITNEAGDIGLPSEGASWDENTLRAVFAHEAAHNVLSKLFVQAMSQAMKTFISRIGEASPQSLSTMDRFGITEGQIDLVAFVSIVSFEPRRAPDILEKYAKIVVEHEPNQARAEFYRRLLNYLKQGGKPENLLALLQAGMTSSPLGSLAESECTPPWLSGPVKRQKEIASSMQPNDVRMVVDMLNLLFQASEPEFRRMRGDK